METVLRSEVLFQRMGGTWFAFSMVGGEAVYSMVPNRVDPRFDSVEIFQIIEGHKMKERALEVA